MVDSSYPSSKHLPEFGDPSESRRSYHDAYFCSAFSDTWLQADTAGDDRRVAAIIKMGGGTNSWMRSNTLAAGDRSKSQYNESVNYTLADGHSKGQRRADIEDRQLNVAALGATALPDTAHLPFP